MFRLLALATLALSASAQQSEAQNYQTKLDLVTKYNDALIYPNSRQYLKNLTLGASFFTENVTGRIDVAGVRPSRP